MKDIWKIAWVSTCRGDRYLMPPLDFLKRKLKIKKNIYSTQLKVFQNILS
jgi:hypothetical protein